MIEETMTEFTDRMVEEQALVATGAVAFTNSIELVYLGEFGFATVWPYNSEDHPIPLYAYAPNAQAMEAELRRLERIIGLYRECADDDVGVRKAAYRKAYEFDMENGDVYLKPDEPEA